MLAFGYVVGFAVGMAGWAFILYEIFVGEGGQVAQGKELDEYVSAAFNTMRFIVTVGWSIYQLRTELRNTNSDKYLDSQISHWPEASRVNI